MRINVAITNTPSFSLDRKFLGIARHDLAILGREFNAGRVLRLISMSTHLREANQNFMNIDAEECAYELRGVVFSELGEMISDECDDESTLGIDVAQACLALHMAYGKDWLLRGYEDYLREEGLDVNSATMKIAYWQAIYDFINGPKAA